MEEGKLELTLAVSCELEKGPASRNPDPSNDL
jgi:hypothetical protein